MREQIKKHFIVLTIILLTILFTAVFQKHGMKEYARFNTETIHYEKGIVVDVSGEEIEYDKDLKLCLGTQELKVKLTSGEEKGKEITVENYLTNTHSVYAQKGTRLIINADRPENMESYYTVYNYDRSIPTIACIAILMLAILAIGRGKGVKAIAGLGYSLYLVVYFLLPAVFSGYSPIGLSILCAVLSTAVTLLLLNGQSQKTLSAVLATTGGVFFALALFMLMSHLTHIDGFSSSEAEGLILIQQSTGLRIKDVLFAGVLISSLGAIMDVGMSIVSALYELHYHNPQLGTKELFRSGIEIGKDMIGTMTNTLILAFTGSAFVTLLVFVSYQVQANQLLNSNYLSIEIAQGICGTFGIVATVPIASGITAFILGKKRETER